MSALADVAMLTFWAFVVLAPWTLAAIGLAMLVGRMVRRREEQVPVEERTEELDLRQILGRTDTVLMERVP